MDGGSGSGEATNGAVHTYHCICANLLFASSGQLSSLPRRSNAKDAAYILPLPPPPASGEEISASADSGNYATLLSASLDRKPVVIRLDDGFEKRYLYRCSRCAITFGYMLDWSQFSADSAASDQTTGRRPDVVYVLPGGVQSTAEMAAGKGLEDSISIATPAGTGPPSVAAIKLSG